MHLEFQCVVLMEVCRKRVCFCIEETDFLSGISIMCGFLRFVHGLCKHEITVSPHLVGGGRYPLNPSTG